MRKIIFAVMAMVAAAAFVCARPQDRSSTDYVALDSGNTIWTGSVDASSATATVIRTTSTVRRELTIFNNSNYTVYLGSSAQTNVSAVAPAGFPVGSLSSANFKSQAAIYAISGGSTTAQIRYIEETQPW